MHILKWFVFPLLLLGLLFSDVEQDPLPSWNSGPAKAKIIQFIHDVTQEGGKDYIPVEDRIVAFDEDGTLWVEQPIYTEFFYAIESIKIMASQHPEWQTKEPFKTILAGDLEGIKNFYPYEMVELMAATHAGMALDQFHEKVAAWLKSALHPRYKRPFTDLVYQPMLEVMELFRKHEFQIYIVSGGGQEFMRVFAEGLYQLPPSHIIGTTGKLKYAYNNGHPQLFKLPELLFINDKQGKPEGINLMIGKRPVAAFGNSIGDQQMLEWTQENKGRTLEYLVHHDDSIREYAYGPNSKVGTFSTALMDEAKEKGWEVISMKNDWKVIFPWELEDKKRP